MSASLVRLARRRGRLPALVAALGIALYLTVRSLLQALLQFATASALVREPSDTGSGLYQLTIDPPRLDLSLLVEPLLQRTLPFAVGVFLALWLIAPLAGELTLRFVLTRGALAATAGAILVIIVGAIIALLEGVGSAVQSGIGGGAVLGVVDRLILAVSVGVGAFVIEVVAVLFASVLLWLWLREHPRSYDVSGLIDEV